MSDAPNNPLDPNAPDQSPASQPNTRPGPSWQPVNVPTAPPAQPGYSPQGYPPQGGPPQNYPPQGPAPQGYGAAPGYPQQPPPSQGQGYGQPVYGSQPSGHLPPPQGQNFAQPPYPQYPAQAYGQPKKRKTWVWIVVSILSILLLGFVGCLTIFYHIGKAAQADPVASLHEKMKNNDLTAIYEASDPNFQTQVGRTRSDELFTLVHYRLGYPISSTQTGVVEDAATNVKTLTYRTHFSRGDGTEEIKLHKSGAEYKLLGYNVDSPALVGAPGAQND